MFQTKATVLVAVRPTRPNSITYRHQRRGFFAGLIGALRRILG